MFCKNCGKELSDETKFCPSCGQPVSSAPMDTTLAENTEAVSQMGESTSNSDTMSSADSITSNPEATDSTAGTMASDEGTDASAANTTASNEGTDASATSTTASDFGAAMDQNTNSLSGSVPMPSYTQPVYSTPNNQPSRIIPKKNGKKIAAIIAAVLVVALIAVGATAHAQITNFIKSTFSSPASYYNYVEKKNLKTGRKNLVENYKKYEETVNGKDSSKSATYKLELGDSAKTMLSMIGIDFSAFESAEIATAAQLKDNVTMAQTKILLNGQDAVTANIYADMNAKEYYLQIPELSDAYLSLSSLFQTPSQSGETTTMQDILFSFGDYIPTSGQMEALYTTYTDLVVDKLTKVEKSSDTLEVDGISQKCTVLKVTVTGKEFYDIAKTFLDTAKKDENIKSIIEKIDKKVESENIYEDFQNMIDSLSTAFEADKDKMETSDANMVMDVFVNNSGDIVGRTITITADNGETINITSHMPESGSKFGYKMSVESGDTTYFSITGNGTRKGGKMSGEFSVSLDESLNPSSAMIASMQDIVTVKIKDLDEDKLEDGYLNGTITLQCNAVAALSTYALEIKASGDKKQSTFAMSVLCADDNLATISMEIKDAKAPSVKKPSDSDTIYDINNNSDMEIFANSIDLDAFLQDIQTKSGIDFSSYLDMIKSLTGGKSDSDYDLSPDQLPGLDDNGIGNNFGADDGIDNSPYSNDGTGLDDSLGQDDWDLDDFNFDDATPTPEADNEL